MPSKALTSRSCKSKTLRATRELALPPNTTNAAADKMAQEHSQHGQEAGRSPLCVIPWPQLSIMELTFHFLFRPTPPRLIRFSPNTPANLSMNSSPKRSSIPTKRPRFRRSLLSRLPWSSMRSSLPNTRKSTSSTRHERRPKRQNGPSLSRRPRRRRSVRPRLILRALSSPSFLFCHNSCVWQPTAARNLRSRTRMRAKPLRVCCLPFTLEMIMPSRLCRS